MKRSGLIILTLLVLVACASPDVSATRPAGAGKDPAPAGVTPYAVSEPSPEPELKLAPPTEAARPEGLPATAAQPPVASQAPDDITVAADSPAESAVSRVLAAEEWKTMPVIPAISERVREIYRFGLEAGRNPHAFSKVGDCGSTPAWFLGDFDRGPKYYNLGEYSQLERVIQYFSGSFDRTSLAARSGFSASSLLTPLWSDPKFCEPGEIPLECEYRTHNPSFALITLGTNDVWHADSFEKQMRKVIEFSIENGIIPILATKADNLEKDHSINATIARLAMEYQVPLWNYWLAVQSLPDQGLQEDGAHITWGSNRFNDPKVMQKGWPVRNLTALQVLEELWLAVEPQ